MIHRYVDPNRINVKTDCVEADELYLGEKVTPHRIIKGFELVEVSDSDLEPGIEVIGELNDCLGIRVLVSGVSDYATSALESLIPEVMNRIKGLEYDFRRENVEIRLSEDTLKKITLDCLGKMLYDAFRSIPSIEKVRVTLIADEDVFNSEIERARKIHAERDEKSRKIKDEDVNEFFGCVSCQYYVPNHVCVISPERPSPCGTSWFDAKVANELDIVQYYFKIEKGDVVDEKGGEYAGVNRAVEEKSEGNIKRVKLHSVLDKPLPTGLYSELIVFYIPEEDGFGIVDRKYRKRTPIGLTFDEMERLIVGQQVEGFVGISFAYLKSKKFLNGEEGWKRVVWVSPRVEEFLKQN